MNPRVFRDPKLGIKHSLSKGSTQFGGGWSSCLGMVKVTNNMFYMEGAAIPVPAFSVTNRILEYLGAQIRYKTFPEYGEGSTQFGGGWSSYLGMVEVTNNLFYMEGTAIPVQAFSVTNWILEYLGSQIRHKTFLEYGVGSTQFGGGWSSCLGMVKMLKGTNNPFYMKGTATSAPALSVTNRCLSILGAQTRP